MGKEKGIYIRTKEIKDKNSISNMGKDHSYSVGVNNHNYNPDAHITCRRECACGCLDTFICNIHSKQRFIRGHHHNGKRNHRYNENLRIMETRVCLCPDHESFECSINSPKKYIQGHHSKGKNNSMYGRACPARGYGKSQKRIDLYNQFFRSTWDANVSRIFNYEGIPWEYECRRFTLKRKDGSSLTYLPDHHIVGTNIWYEQKGYMDEKSLEKITLFKEQYPDEILIVVDKRKYKLFTETYKNIVDFWEK